MEQKTREAIIALKNNNLSRFDFLGGKKKIKRFKKPINFQDQAYAGAIGNGIHHKGINFITHSDLHHKHSAVRTFQNRQKAIIFLILILAIGGGALLIFGKL